MFTIGVAALLGRQGGVVLFAPVLMGGAQVEIEAGSLSVRGR